MAVTPEPMPGMNAVNFRAPPPSPVAPGRRSSFANDDVLTEYLHRSVTEIFPRQKSVQKPPKIDFQNLQLLENEAGIEISERIKRMGCLEVINHGIPRDLIKFVFLLAGGIFEVSLQKKKLVDQSPKRRYKFEEIHGEAEIRVKSFCGVEEKV
ncbi:Flavonol synthase [Handroanthus impetiginosus]|uniref:Flavonol synthase n=1 Tax=Handroanthus impetiginosus TaxID=429701 RepID=A0A2G9GV35_9LAMI|nr:Flavonol synthase [Handroanthus impetiginosus]